MNIEAFSHSKYKNGAKPGDDIILIEPDTLLAVFDGATDPTGAFYKGESSGRIAARSAAQCTARLAASGKLVSASSREIFQALSDSVRDAAIECHIAHPPSTTAAIVVSAGDHFRLLALGDTGIRINGETIYQHHKVIDTISTAARIAVYGILSGRVDDSDEAEMATRKVIFDGLDAAVETGSLAAEEASIAIAAAVAAAETATEIAAKFLKGGIRTQFHYANSTQPLGYASINGNNIIGDGMTDVLLHKSDVASIEIFSDGYVSIPASGIKLGDWEKEFERVEAVDFHKTGAFPAVKGSTSVESCDDRTILSAMLPRSVAI
ncbi:protein phosphatase 2C domain-containing protein [Neorhizobium galegae]|uniref:protein phosphatase 2C domain-containing protein n=1 Tax=Neorhizobium galegae TaxID=399 RepID=UPI001355FC0B|nr:protein phosphatase 2C domain-containing protein [Neorhizobium galegae]KAB1115052.1 protein phosphatase 2C domain-containing protein [Neorhizobium galegae]MCQ1774399.1 protein phosphatase 2C domain-containing protein [Neorhizobium galegae]MCQ1798943.1 protein phosphatase 2C domain-containing protein [Neorhizobium galegae]